MDKLREIQKMINMTKRSVLPEPLASQMARVDLIQAQAALLKSFQPTISLLSQFEVVNPLKHIDSVLRLQKTVVSQRIKALHPFAALESGLGMATSGGISAAIQSNLEVFRVARTRADLAAGIASSAKAIDHLNTGMLSSFSAANLRFPPIETPALEIYKLAKQGWLLDSLLMVAEDDVLPFLESQPSDWSHEDVATAIQQIVQKHEDELLALVRKHLEFLLEGDQAALESHLKVFRVALRSICGGDGSEMAAQAMFARTESLFTRSFRSRGFSKSQIKNVLYTTEEKRAEVRAKLLEDALQHAYERREEQVDNHETDKIFMPYWRQVDFGHERLGVACKAFSQVKPNDDEELIFPMEKARNHAQHDGVGTETLDWAVRLVLWFAGVALVLGSILEPVPQEQAS